MYSVAAALLLTAAVGYSGEGLKGGVMYRLILTEEIKKTTNTSFAQNYLIHLRLAEIPFGRQTGRYANQYTSKCKE